MDKSTEFTIKQQVTNRWSVYYTRYIMTAAQSPLGILKLWKAELTLIMFQKEPAE